MASRRLPRLALMLDAQTGDRPVRGGRQREILIVGELAGSICAELTERGAGITAVDVLHQAFCLLAERRFDVVVVNPFVEGRGFDFVNAIKEGETEHQLTIATVYGARGKARFLSGVSPPPVETLEAARARHRTTPFVVLSSDDTPGYAVIVVPPHASFIEDGVALPLVTAILSVDAAKLLLTAGPMA